MKKLFEISNEFDRSLKNYIVGTGDFALLQFTTLLQENIEVDGFVSLKPVSDDIQIMGKPIIYIDDFSDTDKCNFIIAEEDFADVEQSLKDRGGDGIRNIFVDIRMFSLIKDCNWEFM